MVVDFLFVDAEFFCDLDGIHFTFAYQTQNLPTELVCDSSESFWTVEYGYVFDFIVIGLSAEEEFFVHVLIGRQVLPL